MFGLYLSCFLTVKNGKYFEIWHFFHGFHMFSQYNPFWRKSIFLQLNIFLSILGLSHLCEFIEDCEHTVLATRILHLLGREGPRTQLPGRYIRFIYNRVILENAAVRAGEFEFLIL